MSQEAKTDDSEQLAPDEPFVSYAQNGEDVVLWRALHHVTSGRFVDVGAAHPTEDSVTRAFYDRGWSGINIEPVGPFHDALAAERARDINLRVAAGTEQGALHFYEVPGTGLSTASGVEAEVAASRGFEVVEIDVPERTLDSIFAEYLDAGAPIHFLKIDVEGHEKAVLSGLDLARWRPWVIVVEATRPESTTSTRGEFESLLTANGYQPALFDGLNCYYLADEHEELREALSYPACPLDHFVLHRYESQITVWERHSADQWERIQELDTAWVEMSRVAKDRDWMLATERQYANELANAEARLTASVHELRQDNRKLRRRLNRAEKRVADLQSSRTWVYSSKLRRRAGKALGAAAPTAKRLARDAMNWRRQVRRSGKSAVRPYDVAQLRAKRVPPELPWSAELFTELHALPTLAQFEIGRARLAAHRLDSDEALEERLDRRDDRVGRTLSEMWALVEVLSDRGASAGPESRGSRVVIDARCLQDPAFAQRGIGRFALPALTAAAAAAPDRTVLFISRELPPLPTDLAGLGRQVSSLAELADDIGVFLQLSPMTASIAPLVPALASGALKIAVVFDFIPAEAPETYLADGQERAGYKCRLAALGRFDRLLCISHSTRNALATYGLDPGCADVVWPRWLCDSLTGFEPTLSDSQNRILIAGGADPRKNLAGALAAAAEVCRGDLDADAVVVGYGSSRGRALATAVGAGMPRERLVVAPWVTDDELCEVYASSSFALCAATAEGLSLPPLEALAQGLPVAASDIPAHRELLGQGGHLADPDDMVTAARHVARSRREVFEQQWRHITRHEHEVLEETIASAVGESGAPEREAVPRRWRRFGIGHRPSIGIATPWPPQASGIADYSGFTLAALRDLADLTVYSTYDPASADRTVHRIREATSLVTAHDAFLSVLGNSHFHLPMLRILHDAGGAALGHDTRMLDFYAHLRGAAGAAEVMSRSGTPARASDAQAALDNPMSIKDLCYWEIAHAADPLILHSPSAAKRIHAETGIEPITIGLVPYRMPDAAFLAQRSSVRESLGMTDRTLHLVVVGGIDTVTKRCDTIIEALGWLVQWGVDARLHLVGGGTRETIEILERAALFAGVADRLHMTGRVDRDTYHRYLLAGDLGIQIRSSSVLSISGALADTASFGMPALATEAMVTDMELPAFIRPLPTALSPLLLAEAVTAWLDSRPTFGEAEAQRVAYLDGHTATKYATGLFTALGFEQ